MLRAFTDQHFLARRRSRICHLLIVLCTLELLLARLRGHHHAVGKDVQQILATIEKHPGAPSKTVQVRLKDEARVLSGTLNQRQQQKRKLQSALSQAPSVCRLFVVTPS